MHKGNINTYTHTHAHIRGASSTPPHTLLKRIEHSKWTAYLSHLLIYCTQFSDKLHGSQFSIITGAFLLELLCMQLLFQS